jgi:hypothetical protein
MKEWWIKQVTTSTEYGNRDLFQKFYQTGKWIRLRNAIIAENIFCSTPDCNTLSVDVHHVQRLSTDYGWRLRLSVLDDDAKPNLIAFCSSCHAKITAQEQKTDEPQSSVFNALDEFYL